MKQGSKVSSKQSIFFRFEPKQTETQSVSVVFWFVSHHPQNLSGFVSVFRTGMETIETNITFFKQTETCRKNLQEMHSIKL
jgi:hypothetical protein